MRLSNLLGSRAPVESNGIEALHSFPIQTAGFAIGPQFVLLPLVFAPYIQSSGSLVTGGDVAMRIRQGELFQQLELLLPTGSM